MKTISTFDFSQIINRINSNELDSIYVVTSERYKDDGEESSPIEDSGEIYFAGSSIDEARTCIAKVEAAKTPDEYEMIRLDAYECPVSPEDFMSFDPSTGTAEEFISNYIDEHFDEAESLATYDWAIRIIRPDYEPIEDGILVYWSWVQHVGYAREFKKLEYCLDRDPLICKPTDKVYVPQCSLLVSPSEVQSCKSASELRDLIEKRLDQMGRWRNSYDVDWFLKDEYYFKEVVGKIRHLPENDLYHE